ncbi:hypothetical protein PQR02_08265 [Paraburkholderia sediminicola]|uniref:Uncharacterized protein n=1 Tax=Paraburkholderia rhynchosiae TaxID=487049 RepID=A0ACC7N8L2_9BURK
MQIGGVGMNSPYAGNTGGASPAASAGNGQTTQDLQDQKAQNAFQEEITKESNMESKRNQTRMGVIANLK